MSSWKNLVAAAGLTLAIMAPASAELSADRVHFTKDGQDRVIKVYVSNPGPNHTGVFNVHLLSRTSPNGPWRSVQEWTQVADLEPGEKFIREIRDAEGFSVLQKSMREPGFEMKLVAESPDDVSEKIVRLGADKVDVTWDGF